MLSLNLSFLTNVRSTMISFDLERRREEHQER